MHLISEILPNPTVVTDMIASGEKIFNLGIDFEIDYPALRILRVFQESEFTFDEVKEFTHLPVTDGKIRFIEGTGYDDAILIITKASEIWFATTCSEDTLFVDVVLYSKEKIIVEQEIFCFMTTMKDFHLTDADGEIIKVLKNPLTVIDPEFDVLSFEISYKNHNACSPQFYITNFYWPRYRKPIFAERLEDFSLDFS